MLLSSSKFSALLWVCPISRGFEMSNKSFARHETIDIYIPQSHARLFRPEQTCFQDTGSMQKPLETSASLSNTSANTLCYLVQA